MGYNPLVESGLCGCGCGGTTKIAARTSTRYGWVKGQHLEYLRGHGNYKNWSPRWIEGATPAHRPDLGPCWIWQRSFNEQGYPIGSFVKYGGRPTQLAHRGVYEAEVGPIPRGLELDHLCHNPPCVRPTHMEPVTQRENILRRRTTKLSDADVQAAYDMRLNGLSWRQIARKFDNKVAYQRLIARVKDWCARTGATYV